jgi:uncharacterized protein
MRRPEKEITNRSDLEAILHRAQVGHLALARGDEPYVVPLCFGYRDGVLYAHCAQAGKKLEMLRANPRVCVVFTDHAELTIGTTSCGCSMRYRSVIVTGHAEIITAEPAKRMACDIIMQHYGQPPRNYPAEVLAKTCVIRITVDSMTGKQSGW